MIRPVRTLFTLLACVAVLGLIAGCGGSDSKKPASGSSTPASTSTPSTATGPQTLAARLTAGIAACKRLIEGNPYISAAERPAGKAACAGYRTGKLAPLAAILESACEKAVYAKVPTADQARGIATCKQQWATTH